jgi:AcrR family transcriptional regulator
VTNDTAQRIRDAALGLFTIHGYAGLSMQEVRRTAGVSNGSLYHFFPHKADLVAELRVEGMRDCQSVLLTALNGASDPRAGIEETVRTYLSWVENHRQLASLLFADLPDEVLLASEPALMPFNRQYVRVVAQWLTEQTRAGRLVDAPFEVAHALWLGPTQEFCRHWVRGRSRHRPTSAADHLALGAWRSLAMQPQTVRANHSDGG